MNDHIKYWIVTHELFKHMNCELLIYSLKRIVILFPRHPHGSTINIFSYILDIPYE